MKHIIEIKQLTKTFDDHEVLKSTDLTIREGEFLTLLGPSGCGKSTLLRLISGFIQPTTGEIIINGQQVNGIPPNERQVNMVFQSYALFPHMTVFENVAFGLRCQKIAENDIERRVTKVLDTVKLIALKLRKPHQLSGEQQQRVAIARAIVNEPLVLLLDEPLSALDYGLRKNMQIELKNLQRQLGITFVFVTHDQEEALSMSDRIVVMNDGFIEQIGTPRQVYERPSNLYVAKFVGETNIFDTKVLDVSGKQIEVEIESKKYKLKADTNFNVGDMAYVIIRPEDLKAWDKSECTDKERAKMIPATVESVIYKGSTVDLVLKTDSGRHLSVTEFFDEDDEELDFRCGEKVWLEWTNGWELILPH